eukprot:729698-Hanusia_phi.AAC.2
MDSRTLGPKECEPHCNFECNSECERKYEFPWKCPAECKRDCSNYCKPLTTGSLNNGKFALSPCWRFSHSSRR